ncbi:MAG: EamA family transporter [Armatimonadota bacterium]
MALFYLAISIVCITLFALCYKVAVRLGCELRAVNLWMNGMATGLLVLMFSFKNRGFNTHAALLGVISGVFTYLSTLAFFYHIRKARLAVSWTVIGLAVVFPVVASIFIWREHPSVKQWIGLALLPIAFVLLGIDIGEG